MDKKIKVLGYVWNTNRVIIAIILGLLGFIGSFYSSQYGFNAFSINIIWSIILPILVVLAWGTGYGLLSITFGLTALYPFFLGPYNGWASLVPCLSLYLLILLHGLGRKKRKQSHHWVYNLYVIQGIYSMLRILLYLSLFPLLISLNENFYPSAYTEVTREIVLLFALKGVAVEFVLVALGDALLLLPFVRRFFGLKQSKASRQNTKILVAMVVFGLTFTFLVLALNQYITTGKISLIGLFTGDDFIRSAFLLAAILFVLMGGITVRYVEKMLKTQEDLKERENQYRLANLRIKQLNETLEEKVLSRTRELTEANMELEEFAYTISHDLKSPLRAIDSYGEFLGEDYAHVLDQEGREMVKHIRSISENMMGLINRLLEYSTMTKKQLDLESVNLFQLVQEVYKECSISYAKKEITLTLLGDNIEIMGDKILLRQGLQNLFSNGIKYGKEEQAPIKITFKGTLLENKCFYEFRDEGLGFDAKYTEKVFGLFQKLHKPTEIEGYGIGLTTVRKIIQKHGGTVGIKSKINQGTTVYFTLPLKLEEGNEIV